MKACSLVDLCLAQITADLTIYWNGLPSLPLDLAYSLVTRAFLRHPPLSLPELVTLCHAFWQPSLLSLHSASGLTTPGLQYLSYAHSLVKLDISGNSWLQSLDFLPSLVKLECLNLRDCWRLPEQCLAYIQGLSKLQCLDMENVHCVTDASASTFLSGMRTLRALNLSGTAVADGFLEYLTYGQRMRTWISKAQPSSYSGTTVKSNLCPMTFCNYWSFIEGMDVPTEMPMQHWPCLELVYLKLQGTRISEASIPFILSLVHLMFLDVRNTNILGRSLQSIQAKYRLISIPNSSKVLAHSNSIFVATFHGACGCSSLELETAASRDKFQGKTDWLTPWQQEGLMRLLKEASRRHRS